MQVDDRTTVALVDECRFMRDIVARWMAKKVPELDVVGAVDSIEALRASRVDGTLPDVVLIGELGGDASEVARTIDATVGAGSAAVLVADDALVCHALALSAGATTTLRRHASMFEIAEAVRSARSGRDPRAVPVRRSVPTLSASEVVALRLYLAGSSLSDVADAMGVRYETAKTFLRRIRRKYGALGRPSSTRDDLRLRVVEDGLDLTHSEATETPRASVRTLDRASA